MAEFFEVVYGGTEVDLFDGPGEGHRTYRADGRWITGVESWDSAVFCSLECLVRVLTAEGYRPSESDPDLYWFTGDGAGAYRDATIYGDPSFYEDMAPYACECGERLDTFDEGPMDDDWIGRAYGSGPCGSERRDPDPGRQSLIMEAMAD